VRLPDTPPPDLTGILLVASALLLGWFALLAIGLGLGRRAKGRVKVALVCHLLMSGISGTWLTLGPATDHVRRGLPLDFWYLLVSFGVSFGLGAVAWPYLTFLLVGFLITCHSSPSC
jgi:hypothetical protein